MQLLTNFLALLFVVFPLFAADVPLADKLKESRAQELFSEIRCMVCVSESIADSQAAVAGDMRVTIRTQIMNGLSDDAIKVGLAAKYGDVILMDPPLKSSTFLLWFGPWVILCVGMVGIYFYFRSAKQKSP